MAILLSEGFELNVGAVQRGRKYLQASGGGVGSQVDPRIVGFGGHSNQLLQTKLFTTVPEFVHGWGFQAFRADSGFAAPGWRTYFQLGGVNQASLSMAFSADGRQYTLLLKRGDESGTLLATFGPFWAERWYYFELQITCHTSAGEYDFHVNGASVATGTGLNTAGSGSNDINQMQWQGGGHVSFIDDMYITDGAFLGPIVVAGLLPTANGATVQYIPSSGTNHANLVNDQDDSTLVTTNNLNQVELFAMAAANSIFSTSTILSVSWEVTGAMSTPGNRGLSPRFRDVPGTSSANGPTPVTFVNSSITNHFIHLPVNPVTTGAWLPAELAGQFGLETTV